MLNLLVTQADKLHGGAHNCGAVLYNCTVANIINYEIIKKEAAWLIAVFYQFACFIYASLNVANSLSF